MECLYRPDATLDALLEVQRIAPGAVQQQVEAGAFDEALAAAYAEVGQFENAIRTASQAIELAEQEGHNDLAARIRQRLTLFGSGKPFHERLGP